MYKHVEHTEFTASSIASAGTAPMIRRGILDKNFLTRITPFPIYCKTVCFLEQETLISFADFMIEDRSL
jgi:hypothetical protein